MRAIAAVMLAGAMIAPAGAAEIKIGMMGTTYSPAVIKARVGDVLVFDNDDFTNHWVFAPTSGHAFDLGSQKQSEVRRYTVRMPGKFEIECVNHAAMKIVVEVTP